MAINDYIDRFVDAINEPTRPIPSGAVKPSEALVYAALLTAIGFLAALLTNQSSLIAAIVSWALSVTYMTKGKRMGFVGNLMVSGCVATPFIYGGLVVDRLSSNNLLFASMAFLSNTGREITKGIVDLPGDKLYGIKTLAVLKGEKAAAYAASAFYLTAVGLSVIPWILKLVSLRYLVLVIVSDIGFAFSSFSLLNNPSRENARKIKNRVLIWMFMGLLAFLFG